MITEKKWQALRDLMIALEIYEHDLEEKFIKGWGKGGQKKNKTESAVFLRHVPTALTVKCQTARSREDNRYHARKALCQKVDLLINGQASAQSKELSKVRNQKLRLKRRSKTTD